MYIYNFIFSFFYCVITLHAHDCLFDESSMIIIIIIIIIMLGCISPAPQQNFFSSI